MTIFHVSGCAWFNGQHFDTGACDIAGVPFGLIVLIGAAIIGAVIGHSLATRS